MDDNSLSESMEDYLETILALESEQKVARVKDIADRIGVLRGSVTGALKNLSEKGLVNYEPYRFITLTKKGKKIATEVQRRHRVISSFLGNVLMLPPKTADENACRMEHAMDRQTVDRLVAFIEYIEACPRAGEDWIRRFTEFSVKGQAPDDKVCRECLQKVLNQADPKS